MTEWMDGSSLRPRFPFQPTLGIFFQSLGISYRFKVFLKYGGGSGVKCCTRPGGVQLGVQAKLMQQKVEQTKPVFYTDTFDAQNCKTSN